MSRKFNIFRIRYNGIERMASRRLGKMPDESRFKIGDFFASEDPSVANTWNGTIKPYVETVLEGCSFDKGFNIDLSSLASGAKVTLTNCTVDGVVLTAANAADYLVGDVADLTF